MMKSREDEDMNDRINVVYVENKVKPSWPIELGAVYYKNKIGQRHEWSYRCSLREK